MRVRRATLASAVLAVVIAGACGSARGNVTASADTTDNPSTTTTTTASSTTVATTTSAAATTTTTTPAPVPAGLVAVDPAQYLRPAEIAALDGRGPVLLPTLLPQWWTKTTQRVVAPDVDPAINGSTRPSVVCGLVVVRRGESAS